MDWIYKKYFLVGFLQIIHKKYQWTSFLRKLGTFFKVNKKNVLNVRNLSLNVLLRDMFKQKKFMSGFSRKKRLNFNLKWMKLFNYFFFYLGGFVCVFFFLLFFSFVAFVFKFFFFFLDWKFHKVPNLKLY